LKKISPSRLGPKASSRKKPSVILGAVGQAAPLVPPCGSASRPFVFFSLPSDLWLSSWGPVHRGASQWSWDPCWSSIFFTLSDLWLSSWGPATEVAWDPCWSSIFFTFCRTYGYCPGVLFTEGLLSGLGIPAGLRFFFFFPLLKAN
jgi:hypothetical protein